MNLPIPTLLSDLLATGKWPALESAARGQYQRSLAAADRVRKFAVEEDEIRLYAPPFRTIADELAQASAVAVNGFWKRYGALNEIAPEHALILGDFGLGSDAPIILNYAVDALDPPVFRLRWVPHQPNKWIKGARNFNEFAYLLGLVDGTVFVDGEVASAICRTNEENAVELQSDDPIVLPKIIMDGKSAELRGSGK